MSIDVRRLGEVAKRAAPVFAVCVLALVMELRSGQTGDITAATVAEVSMVVPESHRRLAVSVDAAQRPELEPGDMIDIYGTDPLTGTVVVLGVGLTVTEAADSRVVVAAPSATIAAVAARAGYGHFTIVGY